MDVHTKILVVDDDPAILIATQRVLKQAGYETLGAPDGEAALQMTRAQRPDLVLLDVNLPKMDGFETCRLIKADPNLVGIFIIILSGNTTNSDSQVDGLNMGADGYITRPISNRELLARVQAVLRIQSTERALLSSSAMWSATFDAVSDAIFLTDANYTILKCNHTAAEIWQTPPEALVGKKCYQVVHGTEAPVSTCPLARVLKTKHREVLTYAQNNRWLEAKVDPIFDANGNFTGTVHVITDITERKHTEEALRESEYFFKESQHAAFIGSYKTNFVTGFWESSEVLDHIFGIDQNYSRNIKGWLEIIHPDDREMMDQYLRKDVIAKHAHFNKNYRIIRKSDGQVRWVHGLGEVAFDNEGNIISMIGTIQDITERKHADEALHESEKRFRALIENSSDAITLLDANGRAVYDSPAAPGMLGYTPEDWIGREVFELIHPDDSPKIRELFQNLVEKPSARANSTFRVHHKNGSLLWIEVVATNLLSEPGVEAIVLNYRDITERKQAEAALRESERQMQALVTSLDDIVFEFDEKGNYLNIWTGNENLLAQPKSEILGQHVSKILGEEFARQFVESFKRVLTSGQPEDIEYPLEVISGQRWFLARISPIFVPDGAAKTVCMLVRDITERKQAEEALLASQQIIEGIFNSIPVRVFWKDKNLVYLGCNMEFAHDAGLSDPKDIIGKDDYQMVWRDQAELYRSDDRQIIESGSSKFHIEEPQTTPAGNTITLLTSKIPLRDSTGEVIGILGTYMDITERKQSEQLVRESEKRFRAIFDQAPVAIALLNMQGHPTISNIYLSKMVGYRNDELSKMKFTDFTYPEDVDNDLNQFTELIEGKIPTYRMEKRYVHKNGNLVWANLLVTILRDENGLPQDIIGMAEDITERKQAEEALRASEALSQAILDNSPIGISVRNRTGRLLSANEAWKKIWAISAEDFHDDSTRERQVLKFDERDEYLKQYQSDLRRLYEQGGHLHLPALEIGNSAPDSIQWISQHFYALQDAQGQVDKVVILTEDITQSKQAEEALRDYNARLETDVNARTRELHETQEQLVRQEKLAVLGQMAGGVGHELRNPLSIINNAIYFLRMVQPDADEKVKEYLDIIDTETHNADKIISDLLDFSRIKSVDVESVAVSDLIQRTLERFTAPENVRVTLNLPKKLPGVYVDPHQMVQVLGNLVLNACQAMPKGGKLTLSAKKKGKMVAIAVADTGMGIRPENMKKIFEPLFTTKAKGIGLGLAVSKKLAEANGGRIEVESEPGKGSVFTVYLPVSKELE